MLISILTNSIFDNSILNNLDLKFYFRIYFKFLFKFFILKFSNFYFHLTIFFSWLVGLLGFMAYQPL